MFKVNKRKLALIGGALAVSVATTMAVPLAAMADQTISDNLLVDGNLEVRGGINISTHDLATLQGGLTVTGGAISLGAAGENSISIGTDQADGGIYIGSTSNAVSVLSGTWQIDSSGNVLGVKSLASASDCVSTTSPAVCDSAMAGSVAMTASAAQLVVNDSAVTADSQIFVQDDASLGSKLGITCNQLGTRAYTILSRNPGVSFTIKANVAPLTNKACLSYMIIN